MIRIAPHAVVDESELVETFVRASGPGGQNVNKVASAVQLRFDAAASPGLAEDVKARLATLAGQRMTKDGVIVLFADRFRTQERNRADARDRLIALLAEAAHRPRKRRPTRPTRASQEKRLDGKAKRGAVKSLRRSRPED